jgi:MFS family permease
MATETPASAVPLTKPYPRPTRARYGVLAFLCALAFVLYIDRLCISRAAGHIEHDLGLSHTMMGFVFGAFTVAYGLFEVPTGHWGDRYGSRRVLLRIVLWWSVFTALTGCAFSFGLDTGIRLPGGVPLTDAFAYLLVVRFLFGAGEAGALPNVARTLARWFPPRSRGRAQGLVNSATLVGGAVTPVVAGYLMNGVGWQSLLARAAEHGWRWPVVVANGVGWRWSFALFGVLGVVWAAAFALWFRDDPAEHPGVNEAERRLIRGGGPAAPAEPHPALPWRQVLTSPNVWLLGGIITCSAFVSYIYFFWYPTYLERGRGVDPITSGWLSSAVLAGSAVGATLGGILTDWLARRTGERRWTRRLSGAGALGLSALLLVAGVRCESPVATALVTSLAALCASSMLPCWWSAVTDISGKHLGALFGLMNSLGVPGAVASPLFFGWFVDWRERHGYTGRDQWDPAFYVCAAALLTGAAAWLFVDASRSAVEAPRER